MNNDIELSDLITKINNVFDIHTTKELTEKLKDITLNNKKEYYEKFVDAVKNLEVDWLQKIYQYYEADREEKKQDYTPLSLAKLISKLSDGDEIVTDLCSGSGSLTIQKWVANKNQKFVCKEIDENVIPYLLFNLAVRNISAVVYNMDILQDEVFHEYKVSSEERFSKIEIIK